MKELLYFFVFSFLNLRLTWAQSYELSELVVEGSPISSNRFYKIEAQELNSFSSRSLINALQGQPGIDTQISCAFCGSRRISINGHRGEHTTILIDGLSLHSTVSSFYGVDTIPITGVSSIDVYRGSGNTYTLPESLAGAIVIHTQAIDYTESQFWMSLNQRSEPMVTFQNKQRINSQWAYLVSAQTHNLKPWDIDQNLIAELPGQSSFTTLNKLQWRPNQTSEFSIRLSHGSIQNRGGHLNAGEIKHPTPQLVESHDFVDQDIRNAYIGDPQKIRDQIKVERTEVALNAEATLANQHQVHFAMGFANQGQNAIYTHGYDYRNQDQIFNSRAEYILTPIHSWLLQFGFDIKKQKMKSDSDILFNQLLLPSDQLSHEAYSIFTQAQWLPDAYPFEASISLRLNDIYTHWDDLNKTVKGQLANPKLTFKYLQSDSMTHLFAIGKGYRSPLSLFESQHGTDHYGFTVALDRIETSDNLNYTFLLQTGFDYFEAGLNLSQISNMAYGLDRSHTYDPTLFVNSDQTYQLSTLDAQWAHKFSDQYDIELRGERFFMPIDYKKKLPVASIENRIQIKFQTHIRKHTMQFIGNWIGSRNLSEFAQYSRHFNRVIPITDPLDPNFGDPPTGIDQKNQYAPEFWTLDWHYSYPFLTTLSLEVSILNVFDYTQTRNGDSPLTWDLHGAHYHLDNFHIWGPLRGREFVARFKYSF